MTCPNCKNHIEDNSTKCEWCGTEIQTNNNNSVTNSYSKNNLNYNNIESKKFNFYFLIPGVIVFLIWVFGNILQEGVKQRLFGQDDISIWLITSVIISIIGIVIGLFNKK